MLTTILIVSIAGNVVQGALCRYHKADSERNKNLLSVSRDIVGSLGEKYKNVCWKKNCWSKHYKKDV